MQSLNAALDSEKTLLWGCSVFFSCPTLNPHLLLLCSPPECCYSFFTRRSQRGLTVSRKKGKDFTNNNLFLKKSNTATLKETVSGEISSYCWGMPRAAEYLWASAECCWISVEADTSTSHSQLETFHCWEACEHHYSFRYPETAA